MPANETGGLSIEAPLCRWCAVCSKAPLIALDCCLFVCAGSQPPRVRVVCVRVVCLRASFFTHKLLLQRRGDKFCAGAAGDVHVSRSGNKLKTRTRVITRLITHTLSQMPTSTSKTGAGGPRSGAAACCAAPERQTRCVRAGALAGRQRVFPSRVRTKIQKTIVCQRKNIKKQTAAASTPGCRAARPCRRLALKFRRQPMPQCCWQRPASPG